MNVLKTAKISAYLIALIAGVMSYGHQTTLLLHANAGIYSWAVPLTVDVLAFISALVRNSDIADDASRRAAAATLVLAGSVSVAANIAVGENVIQRIVGFWTVAAYLLAEWFVSRLKAKPAPVEETPEVDPEVIARRKAAAQKAAATRKRNAAAAKRAAAPARTRKAATLSLDAIEAAFADATAEVATRTAARQVIEIAA